MRFVAALGGPLAEAWQELRVSRLRVLLSLIVVAVSVAAFTGVVALGQMLSQGYQEQMERQGGRAALISVTGYDQAAGENVPDDTMTDAMTATTERYGIDWWSRVSYLSVQAADGNYVNAQAVDPDYGVMHRVSMLEGSWFTDADAERFVPVIIINEYWWNQIGSPALATHPSVELESVTYDDQGNPLAGTKLSAMVVGVTPGGDYGDGTGSYSAYVLFDDADQLGSTADNGVSYEAWVPPDDAENLRVAITDSVNAHLPDGAEASAYRQDAFAPENAYDPFGLTLAIFGAIALLILGLGALSLLNITLVTIRHRIREIGVRRSFGATAGRVFFSVMLESVVGTVVAGTVGVALIVFALRLPVVTALIAQGVEDVPPFPLSAAVIGLLVSAGVGALAGLIPALVAVRVKPIDAIRY